MEGDSSALSLNLLIDTKTQRVLFAEADKKAVDFLFNILTLPMATVIKLLTKQEMVGCVANLYESVKNLNDTHIIQPTKQTLLSPLALSLSQEDGFVKEGGMFVIMDDLLVKPADSAIALLTKMNANQLGGKLRVQEKVVEIGIDEVRNLLKASLVSKTDILTTVFLKNKGEFCREGRTWKRKVCYGILICLLIAAIVCDPSTK